MKKNIKTIGLSLLISLCLSQNANAKTNIQIQGPSIPVSNIDNSSDGPFEELLALFDLYTERIGSVEDEDGYNSVKKEFNEKISELDAEYPGYEPSSSELRIIEERFAQYEEERKITCERLEIEDYGDYGDSGEEMKLYDEAEVDSIVESFSSISDPVEKIQAVFESYTEKFDNLDNFFDVLITASTMNAVFEKLNDDLEDSAVEKAIEDENSDLYKAYLRFQESIENAVNRVSEENNETEEIEEVVEEVSEADE